MINPTRVALGATAYLAITFPLAYVWHLVLFKQTYAELGYFTRDEPIVAFGFLAILLQGLLLATLYPWVSRGLRFWAGAARFAAIMGLYHWSTHVLAEAAKHVIAPLSTWFALESAYLVIQFTLGGLALAAIYRNSEPSHDA